MLLLLLLSVVILGLLTGFPVAFVLGGSSILVALIAASLGAFDLHLLAALPNRIYGIMNNDLLIAVPLFVFMGTVLERAKIAEELLEGMASSFGKIKGGLGLSVMLVGALLAASTGIVGATVVTMGLISLPSMLKAGYKPSVATGSICAAGTLGQIIPPSIVLILLGDQISNAYQTAQMDLGIVSTQPVSIADLFLGALIPGIGLVLLYIIWLVLYASTSDEVHTIKNKPSSHSLISTLIPPLLLIFVVLGSILGGFATATESAAVGAVGAIALAFFKGRLSKENLTKVVQTTATTTSMVFSILIGATIFTLVFRGLGGDIVVHDFLTNLPGGLFTVMLITMLTMFVLGFFLDFIEIIFVVVPIVAPIILKMGADPIWLAIMIAINLQTSFLTPPFGFALFYLRGVAPTSIRTTTIYKGVIPFILIQLLMLAILAFQPSIATWLPKTVYGTDTTITVPADNDLNNAYDEIDF
jgi:tripartite ATP-independent transporter DctM subunit